MQVLVTRYFVIPTLWDEYLGSFGQHDEIEIRQDQKTSKPDDNDTFFVGISPSQSETARSPSDDDLVGGILIPPWESHPHPHDRHYRQSLLDNDEHQLAKPSKIPDTSGKEKAASPWWGTGVLSFSLLCRLLLYAQVQVHLWEGEPV